MWTSNASLPQIAAQLRAARRVIVTTHVKPDGDAVGSSIAVTRALNQPGPWQPAGAPKAQAWYFGPPPPWLADVVGSSPHQVLSRNASPATPPDQEPDAIVILDTGSWSQLEAIAEWLSPRREKVIVIDHHIQGDADVAPVRYVDTSSAAVCQPAAELCRLLLQLPDLGSLPPEIATPLYLGLATDTGWFRHSNVTPAVMHTAAELLRARADHLRLFQYTEQNSFGRLKLIARALESVELCASGRLALMTITQKDLRECEAAPGDTGGLTDFTQSLAGVQVSAMFSEALAADFGLSSTSGPITKISLRSKSLEPVVDVNVVAKHLGGGGHARAAGARTQTDIAAAKAEVVRLVELQLRANTR